jgi:hypothetical protein
MNQYIDNSIILRVNKIYMQIWKNDEKGDDKIVAFFNQSIYKANPKSTEVDNYISELRINTIPATKSLEIPLNYLKEITMEEGKNILTFNLVQIRMSTSWLLMIKRELRYLII